MSIRISTLTVLFLAEEDLLLENCLFPQPKKEKEIAFDLRETQ